MTAAIKHDIRTIEAIEAVPHIMQILADTTGLRFICVARVTEDSWTLCARHDQINFNLNPGDELDIQTTLCDQVRAQNSPIVIENAATDSGFSQSPVPTMYGFQSYFSFPIYDNSGAFFGTLCGLDPEPASLKSEKITQLVASFAELIARQIHADNRLTQAQSALTEEQEMAKLREQYIAILGHDIRTPLSSLMMGIDALKETTDADTSQKILSRMENSTHRMSRLITDAMDFTHGKMGKGIALQLATVENLGNVLAHTTAELATLYPQHRIISNIEVSGQFVCDEARLSQLLSNLLVNALVHGDSTQPVEVKAWMLDNTLRLSVANGGEPINEQTQQMLFKPFWRDADQSSSKGLGLGLFIASEIANAHDGKLTVHSDHSQTIFTFTARLDTPV